MQNTKANEGTALRELSLEEAEMVGGGFSWGGLVRDVERVANPIAYIGGVAAGLGVAAKIAQGAVKFARGAAKDAENEFKNLTKMPEDPEGPGPELPPEIWLG
ncbi:MAG TPA: hypothetical protein VGJ20_02885 [Xanthobacteraceae bacterium]|jgi:hypothetical protein